MLAPGTAVGRYVIKRKLAEGGMAEIYLAAAQGPEGFSKEVVIKFIKSFLAAEPQFLQMFASEARLASRLNHANVVQIFDFGRHEDTWFLGMEYVHGASLWELKRRAREKGVSVAPVLTASIISQVARGLQYAHALTDKNGEKLGVVHRDVTPHNVLLSYEGAVKLTDFGIAKATTGQTVPGMLKGKFAYMSPEQSRGEPVDARTDLFALGIVLWELLTGGKLFDGDSDLAVLRAVQESLIPPPSRLNPLVPQELCDLTMKALARPLDERWQSAFEFEKALAGFVLRHAQQVEDTDVGALLRTLFKPEFQAAPTQTLLPGEVSPWSAGDDDDSLGTEGTLLKAQTAMTATPLAPLNDDEAQPQGTEEFKPMVPRQPVRTEAMSPALSRPSRKLPPLPVNPSVLVDAGAITEEPSETSGRRPTQASEAPVESSTPRGLLALLAGTVLTLVAATAVLLLQPGNDAEPPAEEPAPEPIAAVQKAPEPAPVPVPVPVEEPEAVEEDVEEPATAPVVTAEPEKKPAARPASVRKGALTIRAVPFATVTVANRSYEVTGVQTLQVPEGSWEVTLSHPKKKVKERVTIKQGQPAQLSFNAQ